MLVDPTEPARQHELLDRAKVCRQLAAASATVQASSELQKLATRYESMASPRREARARS